MARSKEEEEEYRRLKEEFVRRGGRVERCLTGAYGYDANASFFYSPNWKLKDALSATNGKRIDEYLAGKKDVEARPDGRDDV